MGHDHKTDTIFSICFTCFRNRSLWKCFRNENNFFLTKLFLLRKHLRNESVFETKLTLFQFLKLFFSKKCQKQKLFRVARMGHHARPTLYHKWKERWQRIIKLPQKRCTAATSSLRLRFGITVRASNAVTKHAYC